VNSGLGSVTLQWREPSYDGGSELLGYYVYYKRTGVQEDWTVVDPMLTDEINYFQVAELEQDKQFSFKITARNNKGQSEFSGVRHQYAA
jgi:titin